MRTDVRSLALTTDSDTAVERYNAAIDAYFEYRTAAGKLAKAAVEADPTFAFGHCLRGYLFMLFGSTAFHEPARAALREAEAHLRGASTREIAHVAALRLWLSGDMERTCALWEHILVDHPRDLLALRLQHFALFWLGRSDDLRGAPARVLDAWDETVPGYGNVLGMLSFGLEECGDYAAAERLGKRAVELNPDDLWAIHAVAHVLEMQGRTGDGLAWLDYPADAWDDRNPFRGHLWWHRALYLFERGEFDSVLALYDRTIRSIRSDFYLDIQNAAALLARLEFQGVDVGERWHELADHVAARLDDHVLAFTDAHAMMALAATRRRTEAERLLASLDAFADEPDNSAATTMRPVTIPLCEAILAYGEGDFDGAVERLLSIRHRLIAIGGSHAQRDVFIQLLIAAAMRAGRHALARRLLSERTFLKPRSYGTWRAYAEVLEAMGESERAGAARTRAEAARSV